MNPMIKPHVDDQVGKGAKDAMSACSVSGPHLIPSCNLTSESKKTLDKLH